MRSRRIILAGVLSIKLATLTPYRAPLGDHPLTGDPAPSIGALFESGAAAREGQETVSNATRRYHSLVASS